MLPSSKLPQLLDKIREDHPEIITQGTSLSSWNRERFSPQKVLQSKKRTTQENASKKDSRKDKNWKKFGKSWRAKAIAILLCKPYSSPLCHTLTACHSFRNHGCFNWKRKWRFKWILTANTSYPSLFQMQALPINTITTTTTTTAAAENTLCITRFHSTTATHWANAISKPYSWRILDVFDWWWNTATIQL